MLRDFSELLPEHESLFIVLEKHIELSFIDRTNAKYHQTMANSIARRLRLAIIDLYDLELAGLFDEAVKEFVREQK